MRRVLLVLAILAIIAFGIFHVLSSNKTPDPASNPLQTDTFFGCTALDTIYTQAAGGTIPKLSMINEAINFGSKSPNHQVSLAAQTMKLAVEFAKEGVGGGKPWQNALTDYAVACHNLHIGPGDS